MRASCSASFRFRPPLLLLLLLLLQLEVLGQEEGDGGAVNAVGATQRRHPPGEGLPPRSAARCGHSAAARQPQTEVPARSPGGGVFSVPVGRSAARTPPPPRPLVASFWLRGAPFAVCTLPDEWCITVARAAAIDCCSCRHHERSRRLPATLSSSHHGLPARLSHEKLQHA